MVFNKKHYCIIFDVNNNQILKEYYVYALDFYFARNTALKEFETKIKPYVKKYRDENFKYKVDSIELTDSDEHDIKIEVIQ